MEDGSQLRQSWYTALDDAEAYFRQLLTSPGSEWKRLPNAASDASPKQKGKARVSSVPELVDVTVYRKGAKSGEDVYRMVLDVPSGEDQPSLASWKAVLSTPEIRQEWDPAVEEAHLLELFDRSTRIVKTNYTLGWPANPRDSVTISRSFYDTSTLIDISTSLPRSPDEPAYLRPSPPFVRSHVKLFAWCIQQSPPLPSTDPKKAQGKLRLTCFWQHDLKELWGFGSSTSTLVGQLSTMTLGLFKTVMKRGMRVPKVDGYGNGVSIERVRYQMDREALTVDYSIIPDYDDHSAVFMGTGGGMEEVHALREHRRLTRSIECLLPSLEGWEVQVTLKGSSDEVENLPWSAHALRTSSSSTSLPMPDQILLRITHSALTDNDAVLKVRIVIEVAGGTRGLRLNGLAKSIHDSEDRDPSSYSMPQRILQDVASAVDLSFQTSSSVGTGVSSMDSSSSISTAGATPQASAVLLSGRSLTPDRTQAAQKSILSKVRRNYIYFSSLLQEPEAKWRRTTEARGVAITQLDSIDPTLVVYRAEATFLGVGLWDLYSAIVSPGARVYWDKQHEDAVLLEDVNELSELWHFKTKPAWPVNGRDAVVLKTVYKSPTTIHVFSFSADDPHLFPPIPPVDPNVIRAQIDLQGWAIEALSPTTTSLTLLEQSDPKGWTNKTTTIPNQMISTLAGIGEFAIKCGGPPVVTRLGGKARKREVRYDHDKGSFKLEYLPRGMKAAGSGKGEGEGEHEDLFPSIECELRCDIDTWASSLDIVVDPPPQNISCLRRHRLSLEGGGLWLTLTHDSVFVDEDERLLVLVRKGPGKEKGLVMVNGAKVQVDVEELGEAEIKNLAKQKRIKPIRVPLDQPPAMGVIRKRMGAVEGGEKSGEGESDTGSKNFPGAIAPSSSSTLTATASSGWASAPKNSSPLVRFWSYAVDQATTTTQQAVAAITPASTGDGTPSALDSTRLPMQYALEALAWTQEFYSQGMLSPSSIRPSATASTSSLSLPPAGDGWTLVSDKNDLLIQRKLVSEISPVVPLHKGSKVIQGISAEELSSLIIEPETRKLWDDKFDFSTAPGSGGTRVLETFGSGARTVFLVGRGSFPFRDRGFWAAGVVARGAVAPPLLGGSNRDSGSPGAISRQNTSDAVGPPSPALGSLQNLNLGTNASRTAIYIIAASYSHLSPSAQAFSAQKVNPYTLPLGRIYLDAWVLETLDPYSQENYAIPSTRCTRLVAVDYAGSIPAAMNSVMCTNWVRSIENLEGYVLKEKEKERGRGGTIGAISMPVTRLPPSGFVVSSSKGGVGSRLSEMGVGIAGSEVVVAPFMAWRLRRRDESRVLVDFRSDADKKVYRSLVLVRTSRRGKGSATTTGAHSRASTAHGHTTSPEHRRAMSGDLTPKQSRILGRTATGDQEDGESASGDFASSVANTPHIPGLPSSSSSPLRSGSEIASPTPTRLTSGLPMSMPGTMHVPSPHVHPSLHNLGFPPSSNSPPPPSGNVPAPPPKMRQRAASSGPSAISVHVTSNINTSARYQADGTVLSTNSRGRTAGSGIFTERGELRPSADLVVGEVIVDERVYKEGADDKVPGYSVGVRAWKRGSGEAKGKVPLDAFYASSSSSSSPNATPSTSSTTAASSTPTTSTYPPPENLLDLPLAYTIHTMPSSPLHSSGINAEGASSRHLLRLTLPTAQYQISTVKDPLTGEVRSAPPKPVWMQELEKEGEDGGVFIELVVRPSSATSAVATAPSASDAKDKTKRKKVVLVNGKEVRVVSEKESLSTLGREELLEDRVSRMGILSRIPNESEPLPEELTAPIGVADDLLLPTPPPALTTTISSDVGEGQSANTNGPHDNQAKTAEELRKSERKTGEDSPNTDEVEVSSGGAEGPHVSHVASSGSGGLLGFLQAYPNPLMRLTGSVSRSVSKSTSAGGDSSTANAAAGGVTPAEGAAVEGEADKVSAGTAGSMDDSEGVPLKQMETEMKTPGRAYPLSTVLLVGFIGFLIGSLLRSLLSPADFIYDGTSSREDGNGWREIRRLLEVKYLAGGWDFQVAVVRRH